VKYIINFLSILAGRRFAKAYANNPNPQVANDRLETYKSLRRMLPRVHSRDNSNHFGNHKGSKHKPWKSTQGF